MKNKIEEIENLIIKYSWIVGAHHKTWVIDQIMRIIKGNKYDDFVREYEYTDDKGNPTEEREYEWDTGIPA